MESCKKEKEIRETSLISISLLVIIITGLVGFMTWMSAIHAKTVENAAIIKEANLKIDVKIEREEAILQRLQNIDQRLSRIEGRLQTRDDHSK